MITKTEQKLVDQVNLWLSDSLGTEDVRTVVWNAASMLCRAIATENHDALERAIAELAT